MSPSHRVLVLALTSFVACGADSLPYPSAAPERAPRGAGRRSTFDVPIAPRDRVDVAGVVTMEHGLPSGEGSRPAAARRFLVVDGAGRRCDGLTNDEGGFVCDAVEPPYDVVVDSAAGTPTAYLGITRRDPYLELLERDAPPSAPDAQTVRASVRPECDAPSCWITVVTSSRSGGGSATASCGADPDEPVVVDVEHRWASAPSAGEVIEVDVLVGSDEGARFGYAHHGGVLAAPGETSVIGPVLPAPVGVTEPVTIRARGLDDVLEGWRWTTETSIALGDGARFVVASVPASSVRARLPLLPGSSFRAVVAGVDAHADPRSGFHRSVVAWSASRPLAGASTRGGRSAVQLDVGLGAYPVRPVVGGTLSRGAIGFMWSCAGRRALVTASVADTTRGVLRFRAITSEDELSPSRLRALGLASLLPGPHVLGLVSRSSVGVDEVTSLDPVVRRRHLDPSRSGAVTEVQVPFEVTP